MMLVLATWLLVIILVLIFLIVIMFIYYYNRFVVLENRIDNSSAQIDVQLKKRAELVPSLVKVVKGYVKHEKEIYDKITKARTGLIKSRDLNEKVKAGDLLQGFLSGLIAIAESNPQLRANENYLHLQQELSAIEDKVAFARQYYNDSVMDYENASEKFPGVFFFKLYGRKRKDFLKIPESQRAYPKIEI
ncbi:MAG: LemA family protein [Nanoarchaeota archaeon]